MLRRARPFRLSMAKSPSGDKGLSGRADGQEVQRHLPARREQRVFLAGPKRKAVGKTRSAHW